MALTVHSGEASVEKRQAPRLWRFMSRFGAWNWEWSFGIGVDYDGEVSGSGVMLRLELPHWLATPIRHWTYAHMPEWMKDQRRDDISDVLLESLLVRPIGLPILGGTFQPVKITWGEDSLNG